MIDRLCSRAVESYREFLRTNKEKSLAKNFLADMMDAQCGDSDKSMLQIMCDLKTKIEKGNLRLGRIISRVVDLSYWPDKMRVGDREAEIAFEFEFTTIKYEAEHPDSRIYFNNQMEEWLATTVKKQGLNNEKVRYALSVLQDPSGGM